MSARALVCAYALLALAMLPARASAARPAVIEGVGVSEHFGVRLPLEQRFVSSSGKSVSLGSVLGRGKPALLVLAYNRCAMLCNLVLRGVAQTVRESGWRPGEDFALVTISIDPHETAEEANRTQATAVEQAGYAGQAWRWPFLVGSDESIHAVAERVGFSYRWDERTQQFAHPAVVFAISPQGEVIDYFYGLRHDAAEVRARLASGQPRTPVSAGLGQGLLECFRFEGAAARYWPEIQKWFRVGALAVFGSLLLGLLALFRSRRGVS